MNEIKLPISLKPIVGSIMILALAVSGLLNPGSFPPMVALLLLLIALLVFSQAKRITITQNEIRIKILLGGTKRVDRSEINSITTTTYDHTVGRSIVPQTHFIQIRTTDKRTITISTGSMSQTGYERVLAFLERYYSEKLY